MIWELKYYLRYILYIYMYMFMYIIYLLLIWLGIKLTYQMLLLYDGSQVTDSLGEVVICCSHLYGCRAWDIKTKILAGIGACWKKEVRQIWHLLYTAKSRLSPVPLATTLLRDKGMCRFANFCNSISQFKNNKMKLLSNIGASSG